MAQEEIYGTRNGAYSAWHRRNSTRRYIGIETAQLLAMIDTDAVLWVEYDDDTKEPLALIEAAVDVGQSVKASTVTRKLAERAGIPAYTVLYTLSDEANPADQRELDISGFRVKRLCPKPDKNWRYFNPKEYAEALLKIRQWKAKQLDREFEAGEFPF